MIDRVTFANFKSLRAVTCALSPLTVIVGPNGSGKTSILDGLHYLAQSTQRRIGGIMRGLWSPAQLWSRDASGPMKMALSGRFDNIDARVAITFAIGKGDGGEDRAWTATIDRVWAGEQLSEEESESAPKEDHAWDGQSVEMRALAAHIGAVRKLRLDARQLAAPSYSDEEIPQLGIDGGGLASVLADLKLSNEKVFQEIEDAARKVVPMLKNINPKRSRVQRAERQRIQIDEARIDHAIERSVWGHRLELDFVGASSVPAPLASEGTLLCIGLLTALHAEPQSRLLLLDDLDQALHPRAQCELIAQVRRVQEQSPGLQIVATSHSPYLLDQLSVDEVRLTAVRPDGSTACARLSDHPEFERWKGIAKTGELWSFVGEDWVIQRADLEQVS